VALDEAGRSGCCDSAGTKRQFRSPPFLRVAPPVPKPPPDHSFRFVGSSGPSCEPAQQSPLQVGLDNDTHLIATITSRFAKIVIY
jgi:hypothetical protein